MADGQKKAPGRAGTLQGGKKQHRKGCTYWVRVSAPKVNLVAYMGPFRGRGDGGAIKGGVVWGL